MRKHLEKAQSFGAPLLEFKNVSLLRAGNKHILDRVSFTVHCGEDIAILGPNGAGKSSLIKLITREYYPMAGQKDFFLKIMGRESWNIFELRALLGIVSNDLQYLCTRPVSGEEMVLSGFFGAIGLCNQRVTRAMKKQANEAMEFLEITRLKCRRMDEMSSGEARRFLIARALAHKPKALILDEPMTSLDLHAALKFSDSLRKISRAGIGIILVTHNLQEIIPEITRVILMKDAGVYKDGAKEEIITSRNISRLFNSPVTVCRYKGYYHWQRR
jgi:iron complex transport system ATP-binding protein